MRAIFLSFILSFILSVSLAANALELTDVTGTYMIENAETQKHIEREIAVLAKEGKSTEEHDSLLQEMKGNPATADVTYIIAAETLTLKVKEQEMTGTCSGLMSGADQVDFTVTMHGEARKIRIRKFNDGMILLINRDGMPELTLVLKKKGDSAAPAAPVAPVAQGRLTKALVGRWNQTGVEENKKLMPPPGPGFLELSADQTYQGRLGPGGIESGTWVLDEMDGLLTLTSKGDRLEGMVVVTGDVLKITVEASTYHYQRVVGK